MKVMATSIRRSDESHSIYVLCPDNDVPSGGIKQLYRHVDILNKNGFTASIIHQTPGFRCTWFNNETRISYRSNVELGPLDYLVVPEVYGSVIARIKRGIRKVIFNQCCYKTFWNYSYEKTASVPPYLDKDVIASLVVSDDSMQYLQYVFPQLKVHRIHCGIDQSVFGYELNKRRQIAFMPRKNADDLRQVINVLHYRGALTDFALVPIHDKSETQVADMLKKSLIFLWFGHGEGFGLPPAEAMACGCIVVGYHGMGGKEYFKQEFAYPIPQGEIISFAKVIEEVIRIFNSSPRLLEEKGRRAALFIEQNYSIEREEQDVVEFWTNILAEE